MYCINELMQEITHVHRCLVAEEPAGVFHSRGAGARTVRATVKKERKGRVIVNLCYNAASIFPFSISPLRSFGGVQLFFDGEDRCLGPMSNYSSLPQLSSENCKMMSFLLVAISASGLCFSFEARHPGRRTAYSRMGVHMYTFEYILMLLKCYQ